MGPCSESWTFRGCTGRRTRSRRPRTKGSRYCCRSSPRGPTRARQWIRRRTRTRACRSLIETGFVPVRVDADRHPDVNERYNLGGWPTTAFLTSRGEILSGGTYLSTDQMIAMLRQVADAFRTRASEIAHTGTGRTSCRGFSRTRLQPAGLQPDLDADSAVDSFRSLAPRSFRSSPRRLRIGSKAAAPARAAVRALIRRDDADAELSQIVDVTLDRLDRLVGSRRGRLLVATPRPRTGAGPARRRRSKTTPRCCTCTSRRRCAAGVNAAIAPRRSSQWVRRTHVRSGRAAGFTTRCGAGVVDASMYVDRNAMMVGAFIRAAALFDDIWLRDFALKSLEAVIVPGYKPGDGVAHVGPRPDEPPVRGLLTDQVHVASALIWAHAATGQLPYSMLAAELMQFAIRQMWNDATGTFRDRVDARRPPHAVRAELPRGMRARSACAAHRKPRLPRPRAGHPRVTCRRIPALDLFGAPHALAVREVVDRQGPAGLELTKVDWQLG